MSVQPVALHGTEPPVGGPRRAGAAHPAAQGADRSQANGPGAPHDEVHVSEQARQLSLASAGQEPGSGLQLDFRKLRELAFRSAAATPAQAAIRE